jgi:hypothetical protein
MKLLLAKSWSTVFAQIDLKNALVKLRDGTPGTPVEITIKVGEGNLTYSEKRNMIYTLDRGVLDEVREGDQVPVDVAFGLIWEYITGGDYTGAVGTVEDFLKKRGLYAGNVSSDSDACRPYAVDVVVEYEPPCAPGSTNPKPNETIILADFRYESLDHDLRAATIACTGKCNVVQATSTRSA